MTEAEISAFALMAEENEDLYLSMTFETGDTQVFNSYVSMHSRTNYEDGPDLENCRCLWRLSLRNADIRPRPHTFIHRTNGI